MVLSICHELFSLIQKWGRIFTFLRGIQKKWNTRTVVISFAVLFVISFAVLFVVLKLLLTHIYEWLFFYSILSVYLCYNTFQTIQKNVMKASVVSKLWQNARSHFTSLFPQNTNTNTNKMPANEYQGSQDLRVHNKCLALQETQQLQLMRLLLLEE